MRAEHPSQWAAIRSIAEKLGCTAETLRRWVRQAERDAGQRPGLTTDERAATEGAGARESRTEARERDSEEGVRVFRPGGARPPSEVMVAFIDDHRDRLRGRADLRGVADRPVDVLSAQGASSADPTRRSPRAQRDDVLRGDHSAHLGREPLRCTARARSGSRWAARACAWRAAACGA